MNYAFSVTLRSEGMPFGNEILPELPKIVDLAIEHGPDGAGLITEWLVSAAEIYNAQPSEPERDRSVYVETGVVGAAVSERLPHPADELWIRLRALPVDYAYQSA